MKKIKEKEQKNERGITLIALIVTIIVLMVLAGITLTLILGQNGIIGKAQQAKGVSANADKATADGLNNLDDETEHAIEGIPYAISEAKDGKVLSSTSNTTIKDDEGNTVTIPAGFHIASDSATKQEDGIVIEDKDGNQFVWIPVANISDYSRTDFGSSIQEGYGYSTYSETMPSNEQTSVSTYHGYYIGRYEAGDSLSTTNKALRVYGASVTNKVAIKKGQAPYNYVTIDQANTLATGMKTEEGYIATTKLCSSYAWDTALNFIQKEVTNYATNSTQGSYAGIELSYIDITGIKNTKPSNQAIEIPTGETTSVCSIYDMGGNTWEWTTENCNNTSHPTVIRGGDCSNVCPTYSAGCRASYISEPSNDDISFRVTLYM